MKSYHEYDSILSINVNVPSISVNVHLKGRLDDIGTQLKRDNINIGLSMPRPVLGG